MIPAAVALPQTRSGNVASSDGRRIGVASEERTRNVKVRHDPLCVGPNAGMGKHLPISTNSSALRLYAGASLMWGCETAPGVLHSARRRDGSNATGTSNRTAPGAE